MIPIAICVVCPCSLSGVACAESAAAVEQAPPGEFSVYRSLVLGFSIGHPKSWSREFPWGSCCNGGKARSVHDVLSLPVDPVVLVCPSPPGRVRITVIRRFTRTLDDEIQRIRTAHGYSCEPSEVADLTITDFATADGLVGKRITGGEPAGGASYVFVAQGCAVKLVATCDPEDWPRFETLVDQIARSIKLFPPVDDLPQPGKYKVCSGPGFRFEYPGEWWWAKPYDDEETFLFGKVEIYGAYLGLDTSVVLTVRKETTGQTPQEYVDAQLQTLADSTLPVESRLAAFTTDQQRDGLKLSQACHGTHSVIYVLPGEAGELWVLSCSLGRDGVAEHEAAVDRTARSFRVDVK